MGALSLTLTLSRTLTLTLSLTCGAHGSWAVFDCLTLKVRRTIAPHLSPSTLTLTLTPTITPHTLTLALTLTLTLTLILTCGAHGSWAVLDCLTFRVHPTTEVGVMG